MGQLLAGWGLGFGKTGPVGFDYHHAFSLLAFSEGNRKGWNLLDEPFSSR
jgi:hypothetical protein